MSIHVLVSCFLKGDISIESNTQMLLFNDFMHVFKHFDNLRHDDDLLNDFFNDVRHFNNLLGVGVHGDQAILIAIDSLDLSLDLIAGVSLDNQSVDFDHLVTHGRHLFD